MSELTDRQNCARLDGTMKPGEPNASCVQVELRVVATSNRQARSFIALDTACVSSQVSGSTPGTPRSSHTALLPSPSEWSHRICRSGRWLGSLGTLSNVVVPIAVPEGGGTASTTMRKPKPELRK